MSSSVRFETHGVECFFFYWEVKTTGTLKDEVM